MKRRNFLKFFAAPAAIVAVPAIVAARPEEKPEPEAIPCPLQITEAQVKEFLAEPIRRCAGHQTRVHNASDWRTFVPRREKEIAAARFAEGSYNPYSPDVITQAKNESSAFWTAIADREAKEIEDKAAILGYRTIWPGLHPEFVPIERV